MRPTHRAPRILLALTFAGVCACASTARAVVIAAQSELTNTTAPGNDPGWANVAELGNGTCVYLGNRWVLTAGHVSDNPVRFTDGRAPFEVSLGSKVTLKNPNGTTADLRMFRLAEDPNLPKLEIANASPAEGTIVTMIGSGLDKDLHLVHWNIDARGVWTETTLATGNAQGYSLLDTSRMRWGVNQVLPGAPTFFPTANTFCFSTRFDRPGLPFEAQAAVGDSGGGVFESVDGQWKLVGIMDTLQNRINQPDFTAVFGSNTNSADLSVYRAQILDLMNRPEPLWQNQVNHFDVDNSGHASGRDALLLISELQNGSLGSDLSGAHPGAKPFFDVTGDRVLNTQDALQLISSILGRRANPAVTALSSELFVPEPSSAALGIAALAGFSIAAFTAARRRRR